MNNRDFAQVQFRKKDPDKGRIPAAMTAISLLLTAIMAFGGGYMVGNRQNSTGTLQAEKQALQQHIDTQQKQLAGLRQQLAALARKKSAADKPASDRVGELTFYSKLPKQNVMPSPLGDTGPAAKEKLQGENVDQYADIPPPPDHSRLPISPPKPSVAGAPKPTAKASGSGAQAKQAATAALPRFSLQLASFIRRSDADALVARMHKAGIKGTVVEAKVAGAGTRYRVVSGPFAGMAEAEGMRATVRQKLGINPMLRRD